MTVLQVETDNSQDPFIECTLQSEGVSKVRKNGCAYGTAKRNVGHVTRSSFKVPAALEVHYGWTFTSCALLDKSEFSTKSDLLDNFLSNQIDAYVADVSHQLRSKLRNTDMEVNELNIFCLLLSSGLDYIIEYLDESLSKKDSARHKHMNFVNFVFFGNFLSIKLL
jgi:hypothetical protein